MDARTGAPTAWMPWSSQQGGQPAEQEQPHATAATPAPAAPAPAASAPAWHQFAAVQPPMPAPAPMPSPAYAMGPVPGYYSAASSWWPSMTSTMPPALLPSMPSGLASRLFSVAPTIGQASCMDPTHQYTRQALEQARSEGRLAQERVRQVRRRP